ncbi:glucose repression mediator protein [Tulasnella sp. 408]|nr:glucose repression mediator protein [Tulasnella sp. 408]
MAHPHHSAGPPPLDHATLPPRSHHHHSSHHPPPPPQHAAPPPNGVPPHLPPPPSSHTPRHAHPPPPPPPGPSGGPPPQQPPPAAANGSGPMQVSPATSHHRPPTAGARPSSVRGGAGARSGFTSASLQRLAQSNEETWILLGNLAEQMNDPDRAENAYENALRHNPESERALTQVASIARSRDDFGKAIEFFQRALDVRQENGEVWSALGHCYLMQDDLQKAYAAYQQALYHLPNPKDPKLWYGIGILYDRYGSLDNAEEAFSSVLRMDANFEKAEEILFRLGIIYKQQQKYSESLECFDRILRNPPAPLANLDIWFQIGHVYEQAKNYEQAKEAYERVLADSPNHAKVLQQLGWLYHQPGSSFVNQDMAIQCLTKSLEADSGDAQSWYLLGRAYMAVQKYQKAYEAYQQAVYRDGRNPTFWCSIGVLYYNINQYRDALDAYSRAIRINPYIPEVWFDLGSLYESCNNQISDAIDAYARAADLDPNNQVIKSRLRLLKDVQANGGTMPAAPGPQDVHPTAYASGHGPPNDSRNGMVDQPREFRSPAPPSNGPPPSSAAYPPPHAARPPSSHSYDRRVPSPHVSRAEYPERRDARSPPYSSAPYWGSQHSPPQGHPAPRRPSPPPPPSSAPSRRYDPRYDGEPPRREGWDRDRDVPASRRSEGPPPPLQQQQPPPLHHQHHATSERVDRSYNGTPEYPSKSNGVAPPSSMSKPPPLESATANWRPRGSESPPPTGTGSTRATAEPPKERKKRGGAKEKEDAGTPKPVKEKKERKQPSKRGAGMKQGLVEQETDSRGSVAPMPEPQQLPPAPPFKAPSAHKTSPPQWTTHSNSGTTTPSVPPPAAHVHRPSRSVDEDYDEEGTEREDGHGGAAAALMGLAAGNGRPVPPLPTRTVSNGRLESLLNGGSGGPPSRSPTIPTRGPIDRVRSPPPGRSGTPLKRGASSDETMEGERKRSRIDSNGSSSAASSPPVSSKLNSILSPTEPSSRGPPFNTQSRRASLDTRSDSQSRRSWAEVEHERKVSSTSPSQNKPRSAPISPHGLPPIATLNESPSPSSKGPVRPASPMHVDVPRVPSPVAESA